MNKKHWIFGIATLSLFILITLSFNQAQSQSDLVKRGKYLIDTISACGQCHTPRKGVDPDMSMYLAGHPAGTPPPQYDLGMMQQGIFMATSPTFTAFSGPFGTSFAANLTPDKETGLGDWTEKMFVDAMRTGYHQGNSSNRKIFPPMPIKMAYSGISDGDLKAMWAYLKTIKPIKNEVSSPLNPMGRPY